MIMKTIIIVTVSLAPPADQQMSTAMQISKHFHAYQRIKHFYLA